VNVQKEREDEGPPKVLAVGPLQTVAPRSFILVGLFLLVLFHSQRVAQDLFLPLMLAFLLSFLLSPLLRMLEGPTSRRRWDHVDTLAPIGEFFGPED
jgi:hypothetical protein